jgi:hypothetical protein
MYKSDVNRYVCFVNCPSIHRKRLIMNTDDILALYVTQSGKINMNVEYITVLQTAVLVHRNALHQYLR